MVRCWPDDWNIEGRSRQRKRARNRDVLQTGLYQYFNLKNVVVVVVVEKSPFYVCMYVILNIYFCTYYVCIYSMYILTYLDQVLKKFKYVLVCMNMYIHMHWCIYCRSKYSMVEIYLVKKSFFKLIDFIYSYCACMYVSPCVGVWLYQLRWSSGPSARFDSHRCSGRPYCAPYCTSLPR